MAEPVFTYKIKYIPDRKCCKHLFMIPAHFSAILKSSRHPDIKEWSCEGETDQEVREIAVTFSARFGVTVDQIKFV